MHQQTFKHSSQRAGVFFFLARLIAGSLAVGVETLAVAQPLPPTPRPPAATVAPASTSNFSGTVERYLLNPKGVVDGLLLSNGLQVKFPPHIANCLSAAVKPGDRVKGAGVPGVSINFGQEVRAYRITNTQTQKTVVDQPPLYPPQPSVGSRYENLSAEGTAQRWLVGRRGEIKGIVLSSGAQVKFPPHLGYKLTNLAYKGARIRAQGFGTRSSYGQVLEATSLTVDGQTIPVQGPVPGRQISRPC